MELDPREEMFGKSKKDTFPGRFEVPEDYRASDFPPGFFEPMVDCDYFPTSMTFKDYFDSTLKSGFPKFSGTDDPFITPFPAFFEKFRVTVHLKREDKVPVDTKYAILKSLLVPTSPAEHMMTQFDHCIDLREAYVEAVRQLWQVYRKTASWIKDRAEDDLYAMKPRSSSSHDQLDFVYGVIRQFYTLTQCGKSEKSVAKKACVHILKYLDGNAQLYLKHEQSLKGSNEPEYFKASPKKSLNEIPVLLSQLFNMMDGRQ
jgi:hypothetical protein